MPTAHCIHKRLPDIDEYVPAMHGTHTAALVPPDPVLVVPGGHFVQMELPDGEYEPGSHEVQLELDLPPVVAEYDPAAHNVHKVDAVFGPYSPTLHAKHEEFP